MSDLGSWKRCSTCKNPIGFEETYYRCSVSTCNGKRTGLFFCSVDCWQAHVPEMRHRDAWAEEARSPSRASYEQERADAQVGPAGAATTRRRLVGTEAAAAADEVPTAVGDEPREVLVVTSKLKAFIKARSGMSTSDRVVGVLSDHLRQLAVQALRRAATDGRRTVLDRDFAAVLKDLGLQ